MLIVKTDTFVMFIWLFLQHSCRHKVTNQGSCSITHSMRNSLKSLSLYIPLLPYAPSCFSPFTLLFKPITCNLHLQFCYQYYNRISFMKWHDATHNKSSTFPLNQCQSFIHTSIDWITIERGGESLGFITWKTWPLLPSPLQSYLQEIQGSCLLDLGRFKSMCENQDAAVTLAQLWLFWIWIPSEWINCTLLLFCYGCGVIIIV